MLAHYDFVGGERDQRAARHGVVGHKDRDLALVLTDSLRDLQCRKYQTARRVENEVEWYIGIRHLDRTQNVFGIVDVDVAGNRKTEKPHGLLPMHQQDHPRFPFALELRNLADPHGLEHLLPQHGLDRREYEEEPDNITDRHGILLWLDTQTRSYPPIGIEAEHTLVRVIDAVALPGPDQERAKREPRQESSDMSPPRDVSAGGWQQQPHRRLEQLKQEPETDEDKRIDFDE